MAAMGFVARALLGTLRMMTFGRPPLRTDKLGGACLGACGKKLLDWFYWCPDCMPPGWNNHHPDMAIVGKRVAQIMAGPQVEPGNRKPRTAKQEKEARAFYASRGEAYPYEGERKGA